MMLRVGGLRLQAGVSSLSATRSKSKKAWRSPGIPWSTADVAHPAKAQTSLGNKKTRRSPAVTWSSGEVTHPAKPQTPMGNKGDYPYPLPDGGVQYFGFQYYPRFHGQEDPPVDPAPLHLVTRTRCLLRKPWWDCDIMKKLGLDGKRSDVAIVKNNPENNAMLWKVKHLVKITPIRIPENLPENADPKACFLKETGEFIYSPELKIDDARLEEDKRITEVKWSQFFVDKETRKNWDYPWQLKLC